MTVLKPLAFWKFRQIEPRYLLVVTVQAKNMDEIEKGKGAPTLREQLVALTPKLQMHALALTCSKQTAEDLVQSTHLRALETLHQWTGRGRFDGWVANVIDSV